MPNLLEISQGREVPLSAGIFEAVNKKTPTLAAFDVRTTEDTKFLTLAQTELPTASGFKNYNEGFGGGDPKFELREFDAKLLGAKVQFDLITANRWDKAHMKSGRTWRQIKTESQMEAELKLMNRVLYYGTVIDPKGFPGMKQLTPWSVGNSLSLTADPGEDDYIRTFVNAGGSTANTASSVYSIVFGEMDCQLVACNDGGGELFTVTEPRYQHIAPDPALPDQTLEHEIFQIYGFFGLSVCGMNETPGSVVPTQYSLRRLGNLTEQDGCKLTDWMLEQLVKSHNDGVTPDLVTMNGRSARQWAESRKASTVTAFLGGPGDARNNTVNLSIPIPDNFNGIPVVVDSAIKSNDAIEA